MIAAPADRRLRPFVELLWSADDGNAARPAHREHVLPTGRMHVVLRLGDEPLRLFAGAADAAGWTVSPALIGGARAGFYVREVTRAAGSVGAVLRPGAARAVLGAPAGAFAGAHVPLDTAWGERAVSSLRERLACAASHAERLRIFEQHLLDRLPAGAAVDALVRQSLAQLRDGRSVGDVVRASGWSHRTLTARFAEAVGLTPKRYVRVRRFHRALTMRDAAWADVAAALRYADQAHFTREFREFAGLTPTAYRAAAPLAPSHVRVPSPGQFRSRRRDARGG